MNSRNTAVEARFPPHPLVAVQPAWAAEDIKYAVGWINLCGFTSLHAIEGQVPEEGAGASYSGASVATALTLQGATGGGAHPPCVLPWHQLPASLLVAPAAGQVQSS